MARSGSRTQNNPDFEGRLYPPLPEPAQTHKISHSHKLLCQSPQEQLPVGGIASAYRQKCSRAGSKSNFPGVFQPTFCSSQTQQQMEANFGSEQIKPLPQSGEIQDGNTRNHQNIPPTRGVGHLSRLQRRLLPHTNTGTIQEIPQISYPGPDLPIQGTTLWSVHSSHGIHGSGQRGETDGLTQRYKDPPVPRRLVGESQIQTTLFPPHPDPSQNVSKTRLAGEHREIRIGTKTNLQLPRLPIRPPVRSGQTYTGPVAKPAGQDTNTPISTDLFGQTVHVPDRPANSHREASSPRPVTHETHSVASQKQLESSGISREGYPSAQFFTPTSTMVARGKQCATRSTITPNKTCSANLYRRIKRRVGRSLKQTHCKRFLVGAGKQSTHKLSGIKGSVPSLKRVPRSLCRQDSSSGHRQHYSSSLHKQGRRHEVGPTLCPTLENLNLVFPETSDSKSLTHSGPPECDSGQAIQTGSDHPDRVVPPSRSFSEDMQQMAPTSNRSICHEVQSQVTSVCISGAGLPGCSSGCTHSTMGGPGCLCLSTHRHLGQSGGKDTGLSMPKAHSDRPGVAQHALVLGFGDHVQPNSPQSSKSAKPLVTALQSDLHAWLLEPQQSKNRASLRRWQQELRLLKENQPDQSMKQSGPFLQSGASLIRWTSNHLL